MTGKTRAKRAVNAVMSAEMRHKIRVLRAHLGLGFAETLDEAAMAAVNRRLRRAGLKTTWSGKAVRS